MKSLIAALTVLALSLAASPLCGTAQAIACCKVCKAGKACGNSCIAKDKKCHQPPGCACDG